MDVLAKMKAEKERILAEAKRAADAVDADMARLKELTDKYGLELVQKGGIKPRAITAADLPAYRACINIAENLIKAANAPVEFNVIFDAVSAEGIKLGGNARSTLSAYLAHPKSTVYSMKKGWYWLHDRPEPT